MAMAAGLAFTLTACGDDVTEVNSLMVVLESGKSLEDETCDESHVGDVFYVMDSSAAFVCNGKDWAALGSAVSAEDGSDGKNGKDGENGRDGYSCSVSQNKEGSVTTITCETEDGKVSYDIKNGSDGKDGEDGSDGESCEISSLGKSGSHENGGVAISCGIKTIYVWSGENGEKGDGCSSTDNEDGTVTLQCGDDEPVILYKAVCGDEPYDPAKKFCVNGETYDKCGGKAYDLEKLVCYDDMTFETFTDTRDNQVYRMVTIGEGENAQTWMAENLNYSFAPGTRSWCGGAPYGQKTGGDCSKYGRVYPWAAAVGQEDDNTCVNGDLCIKENLSVQGLCPDGWRMPSYQEFKKMIKAIDPDFGANQSGSAALKTDGTAFMTKMGWGFGKSGGSNASGFSALPAGSIFDGVSYADSRYARFWTSSVYKSTQRPLGFAYFMELDLNTGNVSIDNTVIFDAYSIRCIKD